MVQVRHPLRKVCCADAHVQAETVTKTISIPKDAYDRLRIRKGPNESFSDVIPRLTERRPLAEAAGMLSKPSVKDIREAIEEARRERQRKVKARRKWGREAFLRPGEESFSDDEHWRLAQHLPGRSRGSSPKQFPCLRSMLCGGPSPSESEDRS